MKQETAVTNPLLHRSNRYAITKKEVVIIFLEVMLAMFFVGNFVALFLLFPSLRQTKQQDQEDSALINLSDSASSCVCSTIECVKVATNILMSMNTSINPCDDFYQYACEGFQRMYSYGIPTSVTLTQDILAQKAVHQQLRKLIEKPPKQVESSTKQKVRAYYKSCLDTYHVDLSGIVKELGGLYVYANNSHSLPNSWSLNSAITAYENYAESAVFYATVLPKPMNTTQNVITLGQGSLFLPSRDQYVGKTVTNDRVLAALATMLQKLSYLLVDEDGFVVNQSLIADIIEFDKKRAEIQLSQFELRNRKPNLSNADIAWLQANFAYLDWIEYFTNLFRQVPFTTIEINDPVAIFSYQYFTKLVPLINEYLQSHEGRRTLQNYFVLKAVMYYAPFLGGAFQAAVDEFDFVLRDKPIKRERGDICLQDLGDNIGFPLGALFIEDFFPPYLNSRVETITSIIASAFRRQVEKAFWMEEEARSRSSKKIRGMFFKTGYPDWLLNDTNIYERFSDLSFTEDYLLNKIAAFRFKKLQKLLKLREKPDRSEWPTTPQTVNAFYDSAMNSVVIPAGILRVPFFYPTEGIPLALNFGTLGCIVGHEITHAFDNNGLQYDDLGNINTWWDANSMDEFNRRSRCFVDQFNKYDENDGLPLTGSQTLAENLADDTGVKIAFEAYKTIRDLLPKNSFAKTIIGFNFTSEQLFFIGYAQTRCSLQPTTASRKVDNSLHSPNYYRVIGPLSNSPDFSAAFNCAPGTRMNSNSQSKKCGIW